MTTHKRIFTLLTLLLATSFGCAAETLTLKNKFVLREFTKVGTVYKTTKFARACGADTVVIKDSAEFHIRTMKDEVVTVDNYCLSTKTLLKKDGVQTLTMEYTLKLGAGYSWAPPANITVIYTLKDDEPYLRKRVEIKGLKKGFAIDRLEVERFVTASKSSRGGRGEPVFVDGKWFFGVEFPAAYSRCVDGNTPKAYSGPYDLVGNYSQIFLEGRDELKTPVQGMIRLMHFPGTAREMSWYDAGSKFDPDDKAGLGYGIISKTAVCGIGSDALPMEMNFMAYLDTIRRPVRSFIHYNNWYDIDGKNLEPDNFVGKVYNGFKKGLAPYGVTIQAMVVDNGWENSRSVYQPSTKSFPEGDKSLAALAKRLRDGGSNLGVWMALNNYTNDVKWGESQGYPEAVRNKRFLRNKQYTSLASTKYFAELSRRLPELIKLAKLPYIKHDFNEMCDMGEHNGSLPTDRHGHERAVEATIKLLTIERQANPDIYQNITNWIWFSPWWLQHGNNLWMLSGDHGVNRNLPAISQRKMAITYRDYYLWRVWGKEAAKRPLVPISHLMTHGIIYANRCVVERSTDTIDDWADYVQMYYARGLQLKEWYLTNEMMTPERWKVLGHATRWSEANVRTLANSIFVGDQPDTGAPYGYMCWAADSSHGILTVRNPAPKAQTLTIPFDTSVWYRGEAGKEYHADVIYPYQAPLYSQTFTSHKPFTITIPGNTMLTMNLTPGKATPHLPVVTGRQLPTWVVTPQTTTKATIKLSPATAKRADLLVTLRGHKAVVVTIDGKPIAPYRDNEGSTKSRVGDIPRGLWWMHAYDLRAYAGKTVTLEIALVKPVGKSEISSNMPTVAATGEAWLIADVPTSHPKADNKVTLPVTWRQGYKRETYHLFPAFQIKPATTPVILSNADLAAVTAAKLRVRLFGIQPCKKGIRVIKFNGKKIAEIPNKEMGLKWTEMVIDVPAELLTTIGRKNTIVIENPAREQWKFKDMQIAVKTKDGKWVASSTQTRPQTCSKSWKYHEGTTFKTWSISNAVPLSFLKK